MRRLLGPGLMSLAMFATLMGLGVWQLHRLAWKQALLAEIDAAVARPPAPLAAVDRSDPFQRVTVAGRLRTDLTARYGAEVRDGRMGAQVLAVLERGASSPLLVDLGWAPEGWLLTPGSAPAGGAETSLTGFLRPPEHPGWLSPRDDAPGRHVYTLDPAAIGAVLGLPGLAPYTLVVLAPEPLPAGAVPQPALAMPRPPNDHLSYALTWFGLATVLAVVFALWARKTLTQEGQDR